MRHVRWFGLPFVAFPRIVDANNGTPAWREQNGKYVCRQGFLRTDL